MENNINKNIINATIPPNSIRGSLNNKFDSPAMADPIIKPTIKILKDNKIILKDNRLLIRSKRCKKEDAYSTFKLNLNRTFCTVIVVSLILFGDSFNIYNTLLDH